jgi:hypothetical protein
MAAELFAYKNKITNFVKGDLSAPIGAFLIIGAPELDFGKNKKFLRGRFNH